MEIPEWAASIGKVAAGAVAGVWVGQRGLDARVTALEAERPAMKATIESHTKALEKIHETVQADHDLLTAVDTKLDLVMKTLEMHTRA